LDWRLPGPPEGDKREKRKEIVKEKEEVIEVG